MSREWKETVLGGDGALPDGYRREGRILGRAEFLDTKDRRLWSDSEFASRASTPHATSAVEALVRRRHLERLVERFELDRARPVLDLGCADGTVAHGLLDLGFRKVVSTDILATGVSALDRSLTSEQHGQVLLVVDDMLRMPLSPASFGTVIAWGILSVSGDFDQALEHAWTWLADGGYLLHAEPLREQALVYALVRGDLDEFRRVLGEGTRAGMWDDREDRYPVNTFGFYEKRLSQLPDATVVERGGINMLPSLVLGGLVQAAPVPEDELIELSNLLEDPALDEQVLWRQAYWLVRKG
jgi:SAM-dependent methyltransferase